MLIGIPKEIKIGETRVSMTPALAARCAKLGAKVLVQKGAGLNAGFSDAEFTAAGAKIAPDARTVWKNAEMIVKVKEPLESEFGLMQDGQTVFTYLHLAAAADLTKALLKKNVLGIGYETIEGRDGSLPLLKPMSQIAGRLATQCGAHYLQSQKGGSGVLLGGVPGVMPASVVIVGAGSSGEQACRIAVGMGARVTILDIDTHKLDMLDTEYRGVVSTQFANASNIEEAVADADLVIGAVLVVGAKAPIVVSKKMVQEMRPGSVLVDIAIDQGGCMETIHATSYEEPVYKLHGVVHYAVPNMPAMVGRTATIALTHATEPYLAQFVTKGVEAALEESPGLAKGVNTRAGKVANAAVAKALGYA